MNPTPEPEPKQGLSCIPLTLWTAGLTALLAIPAYSISGMVGLEGLSLSAFLCLLPGWLVFLTFSRYGDPSKVAILFFLSSGCRLAFVLTGFLVTEITKRYSSPKDFVLWLAILFLFTLAFETKQLVKFVNSNGNISST